LFTKPKFNKGTSVNQIISKGLMRILLAGVFICAHAGSKGQTLQNGPNFTLGGFKLAQVHKGESTYDPNVLQRAFSFGYDEPVREGLVDVRISINEAGKVTEVEVLDGFYDAAFLELAVKGMQESTFTPGTVAGVAVAWPKMDMRIIERGAFAPGISEDLKPEYANLLRLESDKKFAEAEALAKLLLATKAVYLFEYALIQDQLTNIYIATERPHEALIASRNATARSMAIRPSVRPDSRIEVNDSLYTDEFLDPASYGIAMEKRFVLALANNQTGEALQIYKILESKANVSNDPSLLADLTPKVAELNQALNLEQPIGSTVKLIHGSWSFVTSTRRVMGITGLQGSVDYIDMVCANSVKKRLAFKNDFEWKIPDALKNCTLEFQGTADSQFLLYEYLN